MLATFTFAEQAENEFSTMNREQWRDLILDSVLAYDNGDPTLLDLLLNQIAAFDTILDKMQDKEDQWQRPVRS